MRWNDERERWRGVIRGLREGDQVILRKFVDQRRIQFESRTLVARDDDEHDALQRIQSLGIFDRYWPYSHLNSAVFDLLLAEPILVGSDAPPTERIRAGANETR